MNTGKSVLRHLHDLLADTYEAALATSLRFKCGASSLLTSLKKLGKKIAVITEGLENA